MNMRKQRILAILLFILYLCAVAYCCFGHFNDLPQIGQDSRWGIPMDKVVHFIMFFAFPILCYAAFRPKSEKGWRIALAVAIIFAIGCAMAAGTEIGQSSTTYRSGDPMDFLADFTALASTSVITLLAELLIFKNKR